MSYEYLDQRIVESMMTNCNDCQINTKHIPYVLGTIHGDLYIVYKQQHSFILTRRVRGDDRYVGIYPHVEELLETLEKLYKKEDVQPNELAQLNAILHGTKTI